MITLHAYLGVNGSTLYKPSHWTLIKLYYAITRRQHPSQPTIHHVVELATGCGAYSQHGTRWYISNIPTNMFHGGHVSMTP